MRQKKYNKYYYIIIKNIIKNIYWIIFLTFIFFNKGEIIASTPSMHEYCYIPPHIATQINPNVLMVMDFSGSMGFPAYVGWEGRYHYDPNRTYYGCFEPDKCYAYVEGSGCKGGEGCKDNGYFEEVSCDCSDRIGSGNCISGNLLNWISATRIDIARKVLTGGKTVSENGTIFLASAGKLGNQWGSGIGPIIEDNLKCRFKITTKSGETTRFLTIKDRGGCPLKKLKNARLYIKVENPENIKGIIHTFCDTSNLNAPIDEKCDINMELMVFGGSRYGEMRVNKSDSIADLINAINTEIPYGYTPAGSALWEAYDYYKQSNDHSYEANTAYIDPGNGDIDPYYDGNETNSISVYCRKSFILFISDGAWNRGEDPIIPAREMRINDLRTDLEGTQNVYTYSIYIFGKSDPQGRKASITISMFGGFEDYDKNDWPYPFTNYPPDSRYVEYPLSQCNPSGTWEEGCKEWDTFNNSPKDGLPYNFYEAEDADELKTALLSALTEILQRSFTGATVGTICSRRGYSSLTIQPGFYPYWEGAKWIGYLKGFWLDYNSNLREDNVEKYYLNLRGGNIDKIFQFVGKENENTMAWIISNETTCTVERKVNAIELIPIFEVGCKLAEKEGSERNIFVNYENSLTSIDDSDFKEWLYNLWEQITGINNSTAECIFNYLIGNELNSNCSNNPWVLRSREFDVSDICRNLGITGNKIWKLGDIIFSNPSIVSKISNNIYHLRYFDSTYREYISSESYQKRNTYVFVGVNDGMLHAFRVGTLTLTGDPNKPYKLTNSKDSSSTTLIGEEEWTFVPKNVLPYLVWYGHKDYCHIPTIDYRSIVIDASINGGATEKRTVNSWRTLLIGMMGFGGKAITVGNETFSSSIFVLDLTEWLDGDANKPTLLWERTLPDNTLTLSFPAIIRQGARDKNGNWYLVIGSGPLDPEGKTFTDAKIYFFDLKTGKLKNTLTLKHNGVPLQVAIGNIVSVDIDNDYQDDAIYFGTYNTTSGNLYRISLKTSSGYYKDVTSLSDTDIKPVFEINRPIFGAPAFAKDNNGNLWVFFGTGRLLNLNDKVIDYFNYFVGFKDSCWNENCTEVYTLSDLEDRTGTEVQLTVTKTTMMCICDWDGCENQEVVVDAVYNGTTVTYPDRGWYHRLDEQELIYSQPFVFGENVDVLIYEATNDICKVGGKTYIMNLNYLTGVPSEKLGILRETAEVGQTISVSGKYLIGPGAPPLGSPLEVTSYNPSTGQYKKLSQTSYGVVVKLTQQTTGSKFLLWIEK